MTGNTHTRMEVDNNEDAMRKDVNVKMLIEDGVTRVTSYLRNFDGDVPKWKDAFYNMWRHQMTWCFAHEIQLHDDLEDGCYIEMLVKDPYLKHVLSTMEDEGYRDIIALPERLGVVPFYDIHNQHFLESEDVYTIIAE